MTEDRPRNLDEPAERAAVTRDSLPPFDPAEPQEPPLVGEHAWGAPTQTSSELPGVPDHFQRLWTPYRMVYIQQGQMPEQDACPFCRAPEPASGRAAAAGQHHLQGPPRRERGGGQHGSGRSTRS